MKIIRVRLTQLTGRLEYEGPFWEERLVRPIDVYPERKAEGADLTPRLDDGAYRVEAAFVTVETDDGVSGIGGPITLDQAHIIGRQLAPLVIGEDPRAT